MNFKPAASIPAAAMTSVHELFLKWKNKRMVKTVKERIVKKDKNIND